MVEKLRRLARRGPRAAVLPVNHHLTQLRRERERAAYGELVSALRDLLGWDALVDAGRVYRGTDPAQMLGLGFSPAFPGGFVRKDAPDFPVSVEEAAVVYRAMLSLSAA